MKKTVAIAGMGWLGLPLAQKLQTLGYEVKGSVTSRQKAKALRSSGYHTLVVEISENGVSGEIDLLLTNADFLIIMIPPGIRKYTGADYVLKMSYFLAEIQRSKIKNLILISI